LNCITQTIMNTAAYQNMLEQVRGGQLPCSIVGVTDAAKQHVLQTLLKGTGRHVFFVTQNDYTAKQMQAGHPDSVYLPAPQVELRAVESKGAETTEKRIEAISSILDAPKVVYLSAKSLCFKMRPYDTFKNLIIRLGAGQIIKPEELMKNLALVGYERTELIEGKGQWSGRGEIIEIFSPQNENPYRITFFDDEIESIRSFDLDSQRSFGEKIERIKILPAVEMQLLPEEKQEFIDYLKREGKDPFSDIAGHYIMQIDQFGHFENIEAFAGVFKDPKTILDYAPDVLLVLDGGAGIDQEYIRSRQEEALLFADILAQGGAFGCEYDYNFEFQSIVDRYKNELIDFENVQRFDRLKKAPQLELKIRSAVGFNGKPDMLLQALQGRIKMNYTVYLFAGSRAKRLSEWLDGENIVAPITRGKYFDVPGISIVSAHIPAGFEIEEKKAYFLSELELFGHTKNKAIRKERKKSVAEFFSDLKTGDIVVHDAYGKGRYLGLKNMEVAGVRSEYMGVPERRPPVRTDRSDRPDTKVYRPGGRGYPSFKARGKRVGEHQIKGTPVGQKDGGRPRFDLSGAGTGEGIPVFAGYGMAAPV